MSVALGAESALFDAGVGVVIVDAFEVFGLDFVPGHMRMSVEAGGDVTN